MIKQTWILTPNPVILTFPDALVGMAKVLVEELLGGTEIRISDSWGGWFQLKGVR